MLALNLVFLIALFTLRNTTSSLGFRSVLIPATKWLHTQTSPRIMWALCENSSHCRSLLFSANLSCSVLKKSTHHNSTRPFWLHTDARKPWGSRHVEWWLVYSRSIFDKVFETAGVEILGRACYGLRVLLSKQVGQKPHIRNVRLLMDHAALCSYCYVVIWMYYLAVMHLLCSACPNISIS